jgi:hypothetical protein
MRIVPSTFLCLFIAAAARATTIVAADLGELSRDAQAIARGRVAAVESRWTVDHRAIETLVTLEVDTYLKGSFGPSLQFVIPGGVLGRYRSVFVGSPQFAADQRVVVFLAASGPALPHLVGFSQGVYRVLWSSDTNAWMVAPTPALPATATTPIVRGDPARVAVPLATFEQQVRALSSMPRRIAPKAPLANHAGGAR